jgi:hypothetical protein
MRMMMNNSCKNLKQSSLIESLVLQKLVIPSPKQAKVLEVQTRHIRHLKVQRLQKVKNHSTLLNQDQNHVRKIVIIYFTGRSNHSEPDS